MDFIRMLRFQLRRKPRQLGVRQADVEVMQPVVSSCSSENAKSFPGQPLATSISRMPRLVET